MITCIEAVLKSDIYKSKITKTKMCNMFWRNGKGSSEAHGRDNILQKTVSTFYIRKQ